MINMVLEKRRNSAGNCVGIFSYSDVDFRKSGDARGNM